MKIKLILAILLGFTVHAFAQSLKINGEYEGKKITRDIFGVVFQLPHRGLSIVYKVEQVNDSIANITIEHYMEGKHSSSTYLKVQIRLKKNRVEFVETEKHPGLNYAGYISGNQFTMNETENKTLMQVVTAVKKNTSKKPVQGPPPPSAESILEQTPPNTDSILEQKEVSDAEFKKLLIGEWVLENDKSQGLKITSTTFTNTIKEISHKSVSYKASNRKKCSCNFGEMPPPPMLLGCVSTPNTKNCYLIYEVVKGKQVTLNFGLIDSAKETVKSFTLVKK